MFSRATAALGVVALAALAAAQSDPQACPIRLNNGDEQAALKAIYDATGGFSWNVNLQWPKLNENPPLFDPCCWIGVTCKLVGGRAHVTELNLAHNNLKGSLPNEIGSLPYLSKLFVHNNKIGGPLPAALGQLDRMELLFLSDNAFTGAVPNLNSMRRLQVLYLENNQLTGSFPPIGNLNNLEAVDVSNNVGMNGPLPETVPRTVKDFRAAGCAFTGSLPPALLSSSTLQSLQVSGNQLTGPVPQIRATIKIVDLSNNKLGCFPPNTDLGIDLRLTNNQFLCLPGVARLPGCVNPAISQLVNVCAGAGFGTCDASGALQIDPNNPQSRVTFRVNDITPLLGCDDVFCFLGAQPHGVATPSGQPNELQCVISPTSVGVYGISLRRSDGTLLSAAGQPVTVQVRAGCGTNQCYASEGRGVCDAMQGCVCDQQRWGGIECDERLCPRNCLAASNHGTCNTASGECQCNAEWGGADCSLVEKDCPNGANGQECSGHGQCVYATGECRCFPSPANVDGKSVIKRYSGAACEVEDCPVIGGVVCAGHGTCAPAPNNDRPCNCQGATGYNCNTGQRSCSGCPTEQIDPDTMGPVASCNTFTGQCVCNINHQGSRCERKQCPTDRPIKYDAMGFVIKDEKNEGVPCSGHGQCNEVTRVCTCDDTWGILSTCSAQRKECMAAASNGMPCGGKAQGNCRPLTGECVCADNIQRAFTGPTCDQPTCPSVWENCDPRPKIQVDPACDPVVQKALGMECVHKVKGTCDQTTGACNCNEGFAGLFCMDLTCVKHPDGSECGVDSVLGKCDRGSGICQCDETAAKKLDPKTACASLLCPGSTHEYDCNEQGECDGKTGTCTCASGFTGDGCGDAAPPWGAIIGGIIGACCCVLICAVAAFYVLRQMAIQRIQNA